MQSVLKNKFNLLLLGFLAELMLRGYSETTRKMPHVIKELLENKPRTFQSGDVATLNEIPGGKVRGK